MADPKQLELIAERVERLLLRHEELQRTNALLLDQVSALRTERDSRSPLPGAAINLPVKGDAPSIRRPISTSFPTRVSSSPAAAT